MNYIARTTCCFKEGIPGIILKRAVTVMAFALMTCLNSGCVGTVFSRMPSSPMESPFGRYPGDAVVLDVKFMSEGDDKYHSALVGALSIIPDIIIDTVLLPIDLIAWPFGFKKNGH